MINQDVPLNRKRVLAVATAAFIFGVAAVVVVFHRDANVAAVPVTRAGPALAPDAHDDASALLQRVRARTQDRPLPRAATPQNAFRPPGTSAADAVRNVEASPERDSAEAQLELAKALQECVSNMHSDTEIEDIAAKRSLRMQNLADFEGHPDRLLAFVTIQAQRMRKIRDDCIALPADQISQWPQILERLALAGDRGAREIYTSSFWLWPYGDQWVDQVSTEEYLRALDLAREFLWERIEQGDCDNMLLNSLSSAPVGPLANYIGFNVLNAQRLSHPLPVRSTQAEADGEQALMEAEQKRLTSALPADQRNEADQVVTYLLGACVQ